MRINARDKDKDERRDDERRKDDDEEIEDAKRK